LLDDQKKPKASEMEAGLPARSVSGAAESPDGVATSPEPVHARPINDQGADPAIPGAKTIATAVPTGGAVPLGDLGDHAAALAGDEQNDDGIELKSLLRETLETVILAVLIFLVIRSLVQNYRIEGQSMEPNFHHGQYLLVNKLAYRLSDHARGDVIVFHYPNNPTQDYIKRIIGLPGDTVEILEGVLYLNGSPVDEPYDQIPMTRNISAQVVEPGNLYVLGDNRPASSDTRTWGQLPQEFVIGKAWLAIWPVETAGLVEHAAFDSRAAAEKSP